MEEKRKFIIVIPSYNPPTSFISYIDELSDMCSAIVVVNDGSEAEYEYIFEKVAENERVTLLSLKENRGKGCALKFAFEFCALKYSPLDIIVTADCDGQHTASDVFSTFKCALNHSTSLILGVRKFIGENVPLRSKFGNVSTALLFKLLYGKKLSDTQTGLRAFSVELASRFCKLKGNGFEFEMNMLIYSVKEDIDIAENSIKTVYTKNEGAKSHFKPISDSIKILFTVLINLNYYVLSSLLSGVVDVGVFHLTAVYILSGLSAKNTMIATVAARFVSSLLNFFLNYKYVFKKKSKHSIYRYYILMLSQLFLSFGFTYLLGNLAGINITIAKIIVDVLLGFVSYYLQRVWVFSKMSKNYIYTPFIRFLRFFARLFSEKYICNINKRASPCVYVCRHLNMHGPMTTLKWMPNDSHLYILSVFFSRSECFKHYKEVTFKHIRIKWLRVSVSYICSRVVPFLVKSIGAIPVFRNYKAVKTLRKSLIYLCRGEDIIVYPDIDYSSGQGSVSEIYDGFLYLGELYKKRTGRTLDFVPIYINESDRTINECTPVTVNSYLYDHESARSYLKESINRKF